MVLLQELNFLQDFFLNPRRDLGSHVLKCFVSMADKGVAGANRRGISEANSVSDGRVISVSENTEDTSSEETARRG